MTTARPAPRPLPYVLIGLPSSRGGPLAMAAAAQGGAVLISAGSLWRAPGGRNRAGFGPIGRAAYALGSHLDSAGFTAMRQGGYRWTIQEYVDFVVTNSQDSAKPFPWRWWSAMDYCCEPEIAGNRAEIERRIALTVTSYGETLETLEGWRQEGVNDVPDPMPILQGRTPADYVACAKALAAEIDRVHPCTCPLGDEDCAAEWHRNRAGLPELVGLGSVCRRDVHGPDGLLALLAVLDAELPAGVRLHLFGVKGDAIPHLGPYLHRIEPMDSMAWDTRARREAQELRKDGAEVSNTVERRAAHLTAWAERQHARLAELVA